jgi:hypothetical protein
MAGFFSSLFSSTKNVNDPSLPCPLGKGKIQVEVVCFPRSNANNTTPISGVVVDASGAEHPKKIKTGQSGRCMFPPLNPSEYDVNVEFTDDQLLTYDVTARWVQLKTKGVAQGRTTEYRFKFPKFNIEFLVLDDMGNALRDIPWVLEYQRPGASDFAKLEEGKTAQNGKVFREPVKRGRYRFSVCELQDPDWSREPVVVGESAQVFVKIDGYTPGGTGLFEILDKLNPSTVVHQLPGSFRSAGDDMEMYADWTPAEGQLASLKHSGVIFRAVYKEAYVFSRSNRIVKKEVLQVKDHQGRTIEEKITLQFSDGSSETATTASGKANMLVPWAATLTRAEIANHNRIRVKADATNASGKAFAVFS